MENFGKSYLKLAKQIYKPINTLEIYDWAKLNCYLPTSYAIPGRFDVNKSRYMIEPLRAIKDLRTRKVVIRKAIQTAGTLIWELATLWMLSNRPMPIQVSMFNEQMVSEEVTDRLYPLMQGCKALKDFIPKDIRDYTKHGIRLPNCTLYVNGQRESAFQAKSIAVEIIDECHLFDRGRLQLAEARLTAFEEKGISKLIVVSQAGTEHDDFDKYFDAGTREYWNVQCPKCEKYFAPQFYETRDDGSHFGLIFDTNDKTYNNETGIYNKQEAINTLRYRCQHCNGEFADSQTLKENWNKSGKYVQTNASGSIAHRSFHWNALVTRDWNLLLNDYLEARELMQKGIYQNIHDFYKQRICKPQSAIESNYVKQHIVTELYDVKLAWPEEVERFATIDCQKYHFWVDIRAWSAAGNSRQLYFNKVKTESDIFDLLKQFQVQPGHTFVDIGWHEEGLVWEFVDRNRFIGLRGDNYGDEKGYKWNIRGKEYTLYFSKPSPIPHSKNNTYYFNFAPNTVRDMFASLRDGKAGKEYKCLDNQDFRKHVFAESKAPIKDKYGNVRWKWIRRHNENHGFDTSVMGVVCTLISDKIHLIPKPYVSQNN